VSALVLAAPARASVGRPALAIGVACSVVFNGLVILALAAMTSAHRAQEDPPAVMHFEQVPPPPPPPPPPPQAKAQPQTQPDTMLPPLPQLDVPDASSGSLALPPQIANDSLSLPLGVPGFTTTPAGGPVGGAAFNEAFDEPPTVTTPLDLDHFYPTQARLRGIQGESSISLHIDAHGQIVTWAINASAPPGIFEQALDKLVHSLRLSPAKRSGVPIPSTLRLRFKWTLNR